MLLIQAMIAAAKADGEVDSDESRRILGKLEEAGASADEQAWVMAELSKPLAIAALVERFRDPKLAAEIYAASLLAIEIDTAAERAYLANLREQLEISEQMVSHVHQSLGVQSF